MNLSAGNAGFQEEENITIKGYVIRKTLDLLFFFLLIFFFFFKKTKTNKQKSRSKTLLGVVTNI